MMRTYLQKQLHKKIAATYYNSQKKWIWLRTKFGSSSWDLRRGWVQGLNGFIWKATGCRGSLEWPPLCKSSQPALCTSSSQPAASASWSGLLGSISQSVRFLVLWAYKWNEEEEEEEKSSLTQLSSSDGEVSVKDGPLLDALGIGGGLLVDSIDSLLDGSLDGPVFAACNLRHSSGAAAQLPAELHGVWRQLVLWISGVRVHLALWRDKFK